MSVIHAIFLQVDERQKGGFFMAETTNLNIRIGKKLKEQADPFYSPANMAALRKSFKEADEGRFVTKTLDELRAMEE